MATSKNVSPEQREHIKALCGIDDLSLLKGERIKKIGYWCNARQALNLTNQELDHYMIHCNADKLLALAMNKLLYHCGLRGHRNEVYGQQIPAVAGYLSSNWTALVSNRSELLTKSEIQDVKLAEIVGASFVPRVEGTTAGTRSSATIATNPSYTPPAYVTPAQAQALAIEEALAAERAKVAEATGVIKVDSPPKDTDTQALPPIRVTQKPGKDPVKVVEPAKPAKPAETTKDPVKVKELAKIKQLTTTK